MPKVTEAQLGFCLDRMAILRGVIPITKERASHTCVDRPHLPCDLCLLDTQKPRIELGLDESGVALCKLFIGDSEIDRFCPGLYI